MKHYDLSELIAMSQGNSDFVKKMVDLFLKTTEESLNEMIVSFKEMKFEEVAGLAHKIKPSIQLMGISELKDVVSDIELNGKSGGEGLDVLVPNLEEVLRVVFKEMKEEYP
tara:strand:+ start:591 stop:923 length:333 start_codon:yes stop_codon:yes gene_type:complete